MFENQSAVCFTSWQQRSNFATNTPKYVVKKISHFKFCDFQLATTASSALVWLVLELGCIYLTLHVMSIKTNLCKWDVLSFSSYKYVGMIVLLLAGGLVLPSAQAYYAALAYVSGALAFFLVRTLKLRIEPEVSVKGPLFPRRLSFNFFRRSKGCKRTGNGSCT